MEPQVELAPVVTGSHRGRILIVEDDLLQVEMLAHCLARLGFETSSCDQSSRVPETVERWRPDLILMDICLPDGDGLGLCERLVDTPRTADIPIIVLSGSEDGDVVRKARLAGCQYFLKKPYDPNTLLLLIEQALRSTAGDLDASL